MLHQLTPYTYLLIAPLFADLDWHLCAAAVLAGTCPGKVYADDPDNPRAAFIFSPEGEFLTGEPIEAFARDLGELIAGDKEEFDSLHVVCTNDGWLPHLTSIMGGLEPIAAERRYYEFSAPSVAVPEVPEGFAVVPVDAALLARRELRNYAAVAEWGMQNWGGAAGFLARGAGVIVLHGDTIASWCLMDCAVGARCEIGIATDPDYRRRGLAALATAATVATCLARGFTRIGWHCWTRNLGSRRAAERVGFAHSGTYTDRGCMIDPARHAAEIALHAARHGDRATALAWRDQVQSNPESTGWTHFHAAAVMAALGDYDAALAHLREAVARGGANAEVMRGAELFIPLHTSPEWPELLARG
jgi:RimJ/RimL family protein N-acetyltransferase